jgi:hypothetical protein
LLSNIQGNFTSSLLLDLGFVHLISSTKTGVKPLFLPLKAPILLGL